MKIEKKLIEETEKFLRDKSVRYIRFEFPDLMGLSRSKTIPIDAFASYTKKGLNIYGGTLGFDSASNIVPGSGIGEEIGYQDARIFPDFDTLIILPWEPETAAVICSFCYADSGEPMPHSSRANLISLTDQAAARGFGVRSGLELEFYLLDAETKKPLFSGQHIFATSRNHFNGFINELMDNLHGIGLNLITHNAEYGSSQFEINFAPADGVAAADDAFRFKTSVKELAVRAGYLATFMSKPMADKAGSGCHVHMGLRNLDGDTNAFVDPSLPHQLSTTATNFTAGVLRHAASMTALMAPTINCYHRFVKGGFSPYRAGWGIEDRTALIRVLATGDDATHLEMRGGSALSNPYLAASATLAAGLLGVDSAYDLPPLSESLAGDDERFELLPTSLESAIERLQQDKAYCEALGEPIITLFSKVKQFEIERWRAHISDWEYEEYMEMY